MESICPKKLNKYWTMHLLNAGSKAENQSIPFEKEYSDAKAKAINDQLEIALFKGDTNSGTANLNKFDGILKLVKTHTGVTTSTTVTATAITTSNVFSIVQGIVGDMSVDIKNEDDLHIACGIDTFEKYINALIAGNFYHYDPDNRVGDWDYKIPGTSVVLMGTKGMNSTDEFVGGRISNFRQGTDLEGEEEQYSIEYAPEAREVRYIAEFKYGVNFAHPSEIVYWKKS